MPQLNVLVITDFYKPEKIGGAEASTEDLVNAYLRFGYKVQVITSVEPDLDTQYYHCSDNLSILRITRKSSSQKLRHFKTIRHRYAVKELKKCIGHKKFDIVHCNNIHTFFSLWIIFYLKKVSSSCILTLRDFNYITHSPFNGYTRYRRLKKNMRVVNFFELKRAKLSFNPFKQLLSRVLIQKFNKVVAISDFLREFYVYNGVKNISVIHNQLELPKLPYVKLDNRSDTIIWCGRATESKGLRNVIYAFEISSEYHDCKLKVYASDNSYLRSIKEYVSKKSISKRIEFYKWIEQSELWQDISNSKLVMYLPCYNEPFGRVPIEAVALGTPVITSDLGGLYEVGREFHTIACVDPFDVNLIASIILRKLSSDSDVDLKQDRCKIRARYCNYRSLINYTDKLDET